MLAFPAAQSYAAHMLYAGLPQRVETLCAELKGEERTQAERVVQICGQLESCAEANSASPLDDETRQALQRELGRLVELLSRRSAKAVCAAKLGRAALADLANDQRGFASTLAECDAQLTVFGY